MKRTAAVLTLIALLVGGAIVYVGRPRGGTEVERTTRGAIEIFDDEGLVGEGAAKAQFNPAGTRLAVVTSQGAGVVEEGAIRVITPPEATVAEAGWLTGTTDLAVLQSPVADRIAIINADGRDTGFVPLSPPLEVGSGHGIAIDSARRRAVIGIERRPALEPVQRNLVVVDLRTGESRDLTPPGGPDEFGPFWLDDGRVLFTQASDGSTAPAVLDVATGAVTTIAADGRAVGVIADIAVYVTGARMLADSGEPQLLYALAEGESVAATDPTGARAAILETTPTGTRLREQSLPQLISP